MRKWFASFATGLFALSTLLALPASHARAADADKPKDAEEHFGQSFFVPPPNWTKKETNGWFTLTPPGVAAGQVVGVYMSPGVKTPNTIDADFKAQVSSLEQGYKVTRAGDVKKTPIDGGWEQLHQTSQVTDANGVPYLRDYNGYRHDGWFNFLMLTGTEAATTEEIVTQYKAFVETVSYDAAPAAAAPAAVPPPLGVKPAAPVPVPAPVGGKDATAAAPAGDAAAVVKSLQGTWIVTEGGFHGKMNAEAKGLHVTFFNSMMSMINAGDNLAITAIDSSKSPGWIDFNTKSGRDPGLGIYKLDGDTLTLCVGSSYDAKPDPRPTAFEMDGKGDLMLLKLKRIPQTPAGQEVKSHMTGTWAVTAASNDAAEFSDEQNKKTSVAIGGDLFTLIEGTRFKQFAIVAVDPTTSPQSIDLWRDKAGPGIYKFEGETLTIAFAKAPARRPSTFDKAAGVTVLTLTRKD